ncbi:MAG: cytochrome d ubiquinol oxidase subunit II [Calditrichia bacterium]
MELTFVFLLIALSIYILFGGADFGGGLLELVLRGYPHLQKKLQQTLAPVWEANHVWLIAVVVILFVGYPRAYASLSTVLFVPIYLALLGIILRGAFFTFRKYDPEPDSWSRYYGWLFRLSSGITPMMFGFIVASLLQPFPLPDAQNVSFFMLYIQPWFTVFGLLSALFVNALFAYLASVFFYGELSEHADRKVVEKRIRFFFACSFILGGLTLALGALKGIVSLDKTFTPLQISVQVVSLIAVWVLFRAMSREQIWTMRLAIGIQVLCILLGWFATQFPVFLRFVDGTTLTVFNAAAPEVTLYWLNIGLVAVLAMVIPMLVYLYRVFEAETP